MTDTLRWVLALLCLSAAAAKAAPAPELRADQLEGQWDYRWGPWKGYIVLRPDGTFHEAEWKNPGFTFTGTWAYAGRTLRLRYGNGGFGLEASRLRLAGNVLTGDDCRPGGVKLTKVYSYPRRRP